MHAQRTSRDVNAPTCDAPRDNSPRGSVDTENTSSSGVMPLTDALFAIDAMLPLKSNEDQSFMNDDNVAAEKSRSKLDEMNLSLHNDKHKNNENSQVSASDPCDWRASSDVESVLSNDGGVSHDSREIRSGQLTSIALVCLIFGIWLYFAFNIFFPSSSPITPQVVSLSPAKSAHHVVEPIQDRANKQTIYGSVAGLVTSIVTLCGGIGLNLRFEKVLILGMATLVANGGALSVGEYIAVSTHDDFVLMQSARGLSEILSTRDQEIQRLVHHYEHRKGLSSSAANNIAHTIAAQDNDDLWVETLMHAELGLMPSCVGPLYAAYSVFVSFLYFGILPYTGAVVTAILRTRRHNLFAPQCSVLFSIILALLALFVFGHESARMRKSMNALFIGFLMMASGLLAVTVSFVGTYLAPREFTRTTPPQTPGPQHRTSTVTFQLVADDTVATTCSSTPSPQTRPRSPQNTRRSVPREHRPGCISADESSWPLFQGPLCKVLFMTWIAIGISLSLRACFFHMAVFGYGLFTCVVTGLGVVPLLLFDCVHKDTGAIANSVACGTMVAASIGLLIESVATSGAWWWQLWLGVALGVAFILCSQALVDEEPAEMLAEVAIDKKDASKILLFVTVMFVHSIAEGVACGVSFERNDSFGRYVAFALAAHNIPEGLAIALVLIPQGFSKRVTTVIAILSSAPQPLLAALSIFFVDSMKYLLPIGLAFAAGAMIYVATTELGMPSLKHLGVKKKITMPCEGYWDPPEECLSFNNKSDTGKRKLTCPQQRAACDDWSACSEEYVRGTDRHEWLVKLARIESSHARITRYRGFAMSRLHENEIVGNAEYDFEDMCWPDGYREHYLENAKLVPSEKFFNMILRVDLAQSIGERAQVSSDDL